MKKFHLFFLVIFTLLFLTQTILTAQTGKVRGKITDATNGDVLPGSNVLFTEFSIGAAADFEGEYIIFAVPAGTYSLTVSYLGYNEKEIEVTILANRTLELDVELEPLVIEGDEVLITAQASAQQQAINQQLSSKTIKNIVSSKQIQELPEANAAEAVARLPGVSLERSGGEGNKVIIRGMAPKYSLIQIDGVTMAATGNGDRSTDLSMISPYMLEGIELTKSVMANQEATATGGIVNFRIRKAPEGLTLNAIAQGGYNGLRDSFKDYKFSIGGSNRFFSNSLGIYAQADYEEANRSSHQLGSVSFTQENLKEPVRTNSMQIRDIYRNVQRIGATVVMDYAMQNSEIKSSNFFSRINREEIQHTNSYDFTQQGFSIDYNDVPKRSLTIMTNSLQFDYRWRNFEINTILSHSYSENDLPKELSSGTGWPNISGNPFSEERDPKFNVNLDPETIPDLLISSVNDASEFMTLGGIGHEESLTSERDLAGDLNVAYNFNVLDQINIKLSIGAKYRYKDKEYDRTSVGIGGQYYLRFAFDHFRDELSPLAENSFLSNDQFLYIESFWDDEYKNEELLNGRYTFSPVLDSEKFRELHDLCYATYDPNNEAIGLWDLITPNFINTNYHDYYGNEEYKAFYIMPEINIGSDLLIVPGVRIEANRTEYTGYRGNRLGVLRDWQRTPVDTVTKVRNNEFLLPMIQVFYSPFDWLTFKAGYTNTLQRPNYDNIMPGWYITNQGQINNLSNFRLKPELSRNWDLQLSVHSDKIGLFSIGAFHKKITDMIFWTGQKVITDTAFFDLPTIMHRQRGAYATNNEFPASNYGFEMEWQSNFWFLPGLLSGLVVNVNYTQNYSEAEYLRTVVRVEVDPVTYRTTLVNDDTTYTSPMIGQPDHLLNLTIGYDIKGFSIRWAMRYSSGIFKSTNWYTALRGFSTDFIRYDLSMRQKLPFDGMEVFLNINNLSGEIEKDVINHMNFSRYLEDYGRTANFGLRYQF